MKTKRNHINITMTFRLHEVKADLTQKRALYTKDTLEGRMSKAYCNKKYAVFLDYKNLLLKMEEKGLSFASLLTLVDEYEKEEPIKSTKQMQFPV